MTGKSEGENEQHPQEGGASKPKKGERIGNINTEISHSDAMKELVL